MLTLLVILAVANLGMTVACALAITQHRSDSADRHHTVVQKTQEIRHRQEEAVYGTRGRVR